MESELTRAYAATRRGRVRSCPVAGMVMIRGFGFRAREPVIFSLSFIALTPPFSATHNTMKHPE